MYNNYNIKLAWTYFGRVINTIIVILFMCLIYFRYFIKRDLVVRHLDGGERELSRHTTSTEYIYIVILF